MILNNSVSDIILSIISSLSIDSFEKNEFLDISSEIFVDGMSKNSCEKNYSFKKLYMILLDLLHNNIFIFFILSSIIIISINKIFSNFIIKGKIYDLNEKNNNNLVYTGFGFSFVIITLIYLFFS